MELFKYYEKRATDFKKGLWSEDKTIVKTTESKSNIPKENTKSSVKPVQTQKQQPKKTEVVKPVTQPSVDSDNIIVYITKTGAKYHRFGCRYLSRSCIPISLEAAKRRYTPCSVCDPPE
jgi:competence protein ComEC